MLYNWKQWTLDELFRQCGIQMLSGSRKWLYRLLSLRLLSELQRFYFSFNGKGARFLGREHFQPDQLMFTDYDDSVGLRGLNRLQRACFAYNGKLSQLFELKEWFDSERLLIIEYNDLVKNKERLLPRIFDFARLHYEKEYSNIIHPRSLKKAEDLTAHEVETIESLCTPVYERAVRLALR
jgi:hypothetical protein